MIGAVVRLGRAIAWLAVVLALSLGGAGLVAEANHPPGTPARAELTWAGDRDLESGLDEAVAALRDIEDQVDRLGLLGRGALAALVSLDDDTLADVIDEGSVLALELEVASNRLDATLAAMPGDDPADALRYADAVRGRRVAIREALAVTAGLAFAWSELTDEARAASRLVAMLLAHDETVAEAATAGRERRYEDALAALERAGLELDEAERLRDSFGPTADVSTINDWIGRYREYDDALAELYGLLAESDGRVTDDVRRAYQREEAARAALPPDRRALEVIVVDLGRTSLSRAVIGIEQARGRLALALGELATPDG